MHNYCTCVPGGQFFWYSKIIQQIITKKISGIDKIKLKSTFSHIFILLSLPSKLYFQQCVLFIPWTFQTPMSISEFHILNNVPLIETVITAILSKVYLSVKPQKVGVRSSHNLEHCLQVRSVSTHRSGAYVLLKYLFSRWKVSSIRYDTQKYVNKFKHIIYLCFTKKGWGVLQHQSSFQLITCISTAVLHLLGLTRFSISYTEEESLLCQIFKTQKNKFSHALHVTQFPWSNASDIHSV